MHTKVDNKLPFPYDTEKFKKNVKPETKGKFIYLGEEKFYIKGVTYGTFRPDKKGDQYNEPEIVERDFHLISSNNINSIRTYTVPPKWFLDIAQKYGLKVLVGIPWVQHITFLDEKKTKNEIVRKVKESVKNWGDHPSVLGFAIGNEIPSSIVRWYGHKKIEQFLHKLYKVAKNESPESLITYINYPTTEYLDLSFLDFISFNVYLESQSDYESYLSRLQNIAGDLPLIIAEIGLDSRRNGLDVQAEKIDWQTKSSFSHGCAGTFIFSWTDEWHRGGYDVEDWDFGITDRNRKEKPALPAVKNAYLYVLFNNLKDPPLISVVVCSYNGSSTIRECLEGLSKLSYPNFEVIIVNDGSSDSTSKICEEYIIKHNFRLISTENLGLSNARNTGIMACKGDIVAFIDDDASPDPDWLTYLSHSYKNNKNFVGFGGPNLCPSDDGLIAQCVAESPGGPVHVLINDVEAEHIAGCNMSFLKRALLEVGAFDTQYRIAGDDVDMCWKLIESGYKIGYSPSALVWHRRRDSIKAYLKQQFNYGKAESMLEQKWPEKFNRLGHISWKGEIYGNGRDHLFNKFGSKIYQGIWGTAPFQSIYRNGRSFIKSLTQTPEWYLLAGFLGFISILGIFWKPLIYSIPLFFLSTAMIFLNVIDGTLSSSFGNSNLSSYKKLKTYSIVGLLHLLQPLYRLLGRLSFGLTPWRNRANKDFIFPKSRYIEFWRDKWLSPQYIISSLEESLKQDKVYVLRGGSFDRWDLEIRNSLFGASRILMTIEEHGYGNQMIKFGLWPKVSYYNVGLNFMVSLLSLFAILGGSYGVGGILGLLVAVNIFFSVRNTGTSMGLFMKKINSEFLDSL